MSKNKFRKISKDITADFHIGEYVSVVIKKIAFLVHDPSMLVHYGDVWKALDASRFVIILTSGFAVSPENIERNSVAEFLYYVNSNGYDVINIEDVISYGMMFESVVSNHLISGSSIEIKIDNEVEKSKKRDNRSLHLLGEPIKWQFKVNSYTYLPLQVGYKQIRYMYGADISDGWSLAKWNELYDVFLCHGVNDEREINKRFKGKTFIMGYPRYDRFFSEQIDLKSIKAEFSIDESKKTLLWMPTLGGEYSSIPIFAEAISSINERFNIIVRPHPLSFIQEKDYINLLEHFNFNIDRNAIRDMNELYSIADIVLVDNGGTPFSAIFLGKNLIFLDVPSDLDSKSFLSGCFINSSVMSLKTHLPSLNVPNIDRLDELLDSNAFYMENDKTIDFLFKKFFDSPRGGGAKRVVEILNSLYAD